VPWEQSRGRFVLVVLAVIALYVGQGLFYTRTLISSEDEESYLALGLLAVQGRLSLFQDEVTGQRLPLPFYLFGASQIVFGRDLWMARLMSLGLGLGALALTMRAAHNLWGRRASWLAGVLLASQGAIVAYYAIAAYHALSALLLVAVVVLFVEPRLRARYWVGIAVASLMPVSRTNMIAAVPLLWTWAALATRTWMSRLLLLVAVLVPFALFLLWDPTHMKLLAHIPVLGRLVEERGYRSIVYFQAIEPVTWSAQVRSLAMFARRYESWTLTAAVLLVGLGSLRARGVAAAAAARPAVLGVAAVFAGMLAWHFVMFRQNFKWVIAYFPDYAPLGAVLLGGAAVTVLSQEALPSTVRRLVVVGLGAACLVSVVFIRSPMMPQPRPRPFALDSVQRIERAAARIADYVPAGERVFLFGPGMGVYLAGREAYLQQFLSPSTLAVRDEDAVAVARSGVWGRAQVERWLGQDAEYAIVTPLFLDAYAATRPVAIARIRTLLHDRFEQVVRIDDAPWAVYEVYRRRGGAARA
jgi:hypothetical protein